VVDVSEEWRAEEDEEDVENRYREHRQRQRQEGRLHSNFVLTTSTSRSRGQGAEHTTRGWGGAWPVSPEPAGGQQTSTQPAWTETNIARVSISPPTGSSTSLGNCKRRQSAKKTSWTAFAVRDAGLSLSRTGCIAVSGSAGRSLAFFLAWAFFGIVTWCKGGI